MMKSGVDQDALITMFSEAGAKQGEALREAVRSATLKALQGRELTLDNVRKVVKSVAGATSMGAAQNPASAADVEAMLGKSLAGMDAALLQAVEANRKALEQFVGNGVALTEKPLQQALTSIEKMEDMFFSTIGKAGKMAGPLQGSWDQALSTLQMKGSATGAQATQTVEALLAQAQAALRDSRATGVRAAKAMLDSYAAMASGVLLGMSEAMQKAPPASGPAHAPAASPASAGSAARAAPVRKRARRST